MTKIEPTTLAYLAGVVDSDGYITVSRSISKGRRYYGGQVGIAGTRREPHDLAVSIWGGTVHCYIPKNTLHRPQFQWARTGRMAAEIAGSLMPFLRVKREQAELVLEAEALSELARADDPFPWLGPDYDVKNDLEALYVAAKSLNCRRPRGKQLVMHFSSARTPPAHESAEVIFLALDGTIYHRAEDAPPGAVRMRCVGKKAAGRLLDGREWNEMPSTLQEAA